jgi:hypothetical protein
MFSLRPALLAIATTALVVTASAAPTFAHQPAPTDHLVGTVYPRALTAAGQDWSDLGDLQATQYMTVTATGIAGSTALTFVGGGPHGVKRDVVLANGVPAHIDFGEAQNPDGTGELIALWAPSNNQTSIHLDIVAAAH